MRRSSRCGSAVHRTIQNSPSTQVPGTMPRLEYSETPDSFPVPENRSGRTGTRYCRIRSFRSGAGAVPCHGPHGMDMVRAGIAIYGMYPSDEVDHNSVKLTPAMEIKSCITYIKEIEAGTAVSYGGTFVADHTMKVATIPVGYGDGYVRSLSGKGDVLIHGKRAAILGRICMDQFMVDVTDIPDVQEDDEVTLLGSDGAECITMEELAEKSGGFHYEMICDIGKRIPRVYLKDGKVVGTKDYFDDVFKGFE